MSGRIPLTIVGCGHVGLVTAACFAALGHDVVGVDDDPTRIEALDNGICPIYEPGLDEALGAGTAAGRLRFTADLAAGVAHGDVVFICVGTPSKATGEANLVFVERVAEGIARTAPPGRRLVVEKSTVPVQTGERIKLVLDRNTRPGRTLDVASNPEFLREGTAIDDFMRPERIVVGAATGEALETLRTLYEPIVEASGAPLIATDIRTAELIKAACNAFLATKISYINAVADICERIDADVEAVSFAMGCDSRIGPAFLRPGAGYGGACLPKDVDAFVARARELGYDFRLLEEVARINNRTRGAIVEKIRRELWHLEGKQIAVLGLAFKPHTDDTRNAPALEVIRELVAAGATVRAYDPVVTVNATRAEVPGIRPCLDVYEALSGSHAAVVLTDWPEFHEMDLARAAEIMTHPIIIDGRNMLSPKELAAHGFTYVPTGRPAVRPDADGRDVLGELAAEV